jgi:hypothetical protein
VAHKVVLTPKGLDDIRRNTAWMARHFSPRSAARWNDGIVAAVRQQRAYRMEVDLNVLYGLLRAVAVRSDLIVYTQLSELYEQQTGDWVDPHLGWRLPLATIARRCAGLCRPRHRPILSAIVINNPEGPSDVPGRPGLGFWGLRTVGGAALTPERPSEDDWVGMCGAVYRQEWPVELDGLPRA